ncbi:hypothetical protein V8E54_004776 [Elaphomyces granulatus]
MAESGDSSSPVSPGNEFEDPLRVKLLNEAIGDLLETVHAIVWACLWLCPIDQRQPQRLENGIRAQLDIEEEDEEEEESIPFSEHDSWGPVGILAQERAHLQSLPCSQKLTRSPKHCPTLRNLQILSGEDDTMKQKEDISGITERTSSERRPKKRKGKKPTGKGCTLGYDEDQLPIDETDPSVLTFPTKAGAFALRILSYDNSLALGGIGRSGLVRT